MSKFLKDITIHQSWENFFNREDVKKELEKIENVLVGNFTPSKDKVFRFASIDIYKVLILIIGRDPYPQPGVSTGRAFEVSKVDNWFDSRVNSSLKNIIKLINKSYLSKPVGSGINEVRKEIEDGTFKIPSPDIAFDYWENQGVLFLNSAFTCRVGDFSDAGSHVHIWRDFFNMLLQYITSENPHIKYFLWGSSRNFKKKLNELEVRDEKIYQAYHPCTNGDIGEYRNNSKFLNCPCFKDTMDDINWIYKD